MTKTSEDMCSSSSGRKVTERRVGSSKRERELGIQESTKGGG